MATTKEKAPKTGGTPKAGKEKAAPGATDAAPKAAEGTPRLQTYYETVVRARLAKQFGITNPMQIPRISKEKSRLISCWMRSAGTTIPADGN